jgi:hypothetical protein
MSTTQLSPSVDLLETIRESALWNIIHSDSNPDSINPQHVDRILQKIIVFGKTEEGIAWSNQIQQKIDTCRQQEWRWEPSVPLLTPQDVVNWFLIALYPNHLIDTHPTDVQDTLITRCKEVYQIVVNNSIVPSSFSKKVYTLLLLYREWKTKDAVDKIQLLETLCKEYQNAIDSLQGTEHTPVLDVYIRLRDTVLKTLERCRQWTVDTPTVDADVEMML